MQVQNDDADTRASVRANLDRGIGYGWLAPAVTMAAMASGNLPLSAQPDPARWTWFPRIAARAPGTDARLVRAGRDFTVATLQRWGAAERSEDITIVVSELLTNALLHALPQAGQAAAASRVRLGLLQPGRYVMCAVADPSPRAPAPAEPGRFSESGRGLRVVGALADSWGYTPPDDSGKVVWALFGLHGAPAHRQDPPRLSTAVTTPPSTLQRYTCIRMLNQMP